MPELPEVETIRRGLSPLLKGREICGVEVLEPRLRKPLTPTFASLLQGRVIEQVFRRGKCLCLRLDQGQVWLIHLGMTGRLLIGSSPNGSPSYECVRVTLEGGLYLHYRDVRRFGFMVVGEEGELWELRSLGVEPLSKAFTPDYLKAYCSLSRRSIRDLLLDQRVVAGIGNIYAHEILFRARILPLRPALSLEDQEVERVVEAIRAVLQEAIRFRGSSISDYLDSWGRKGAFQKRFCVYGREGKPCLLCATPISRLRQGGRSVFFCSTCQV